MKNKVVFEALGLTAYASTDTQWLAVIGRDVEYGWPLNSIESPSFVRKALGLKVRITDGL